MATYHTHGRVAGTPNSILQCADKRGYRAAPGSSQCTPTSTYCDFHVADSLNEPAYIIDYQNVYRIRPNMPRAHTGDAEA